MSERGKDLAADVFHLISAHEVVPTRWATPCYFAVCGAVVETASMVVGTGCPNECECEFTATMAYCPDCVRAAIELNNRAGVGDAVTGCREGAGFRIPTGPGRPESVDQLRIPGTRGN